MDIDWQSLIKVAVVAFAFGVGIVAVFSLGVLGLSSGSSSRKEVDGVVQLENSSGALPAGVGRTLAFVCFAGCAAAVCYGLWLMIPQFH